MKLLILIFGFKKYWYWYCYWSLFFSGTIFWYWSRYWKLNLRNYWFVIEPKFDFVPSPLKDCSSSRYAFIFPGRLKCCLGCIPLSACSYRYNYVFFRARTSKVGLGSGQRLPTFFWWRGKTFQLWTSRELATLTANSGKLCFLLVYPRCG